MIKSDLERAIELNPQDDIAFSILGSFYIALGDVSWIERQLAAIFLGGLPEGGFLEAKENLTRAILLAPGIIRHHIELGRLFMLLERHEEALTEFRLVLSLPVKWGSDERTQQLASEFISRLEDR
jgi:tetratricopeptide (TPR) repeat protein